MPSILILIAGPLWSNPRSFKEAESLSAAGHSVRVSGIWFDQRAADLDLRLQAGRAWRFEPFLDLRPARPAGRVRNLVARLRNRIAREAYARSGRLSPELLGYGAQKMLETAVRNSADLTIVRSEVGMWVANALLDGRQAVGVDFEDWYSEDMAAEARASRPVRWLKQLERRAAAECVYSVTTSKAMAESIAAAYAVPAPQVVYNVFPMTGIAHLDGIRKDRGNSARPSVHWFSQTIGPGRGLELLFAAAERVSIAFEIHLRGRLPGNYADWFARIVPAGMSGRVFIHDTVPNEELRSRIAEHDVGLALEAPEPASRNLTVTNKLFQYMQAGLAIVATDTAGQREVMSQAPGAGTLVRNNDPAALASALDALLGDERRLLDAKGASLAAFREKFHWENQGELVVRLAGRAMGG